MPWRLHTPSLSGPPSSCTNVVVFSLNCRWICWLTDTSHYFDCSLFSGVLWLTHRHETAINLIQVAVEHLFEVVTRLWVNAAPILQKPKRKHWDMGIKFSKPLSHKLHSIFLGKYCLMNRRNLGIGCQTQTKWCRLLKI